jgi:hypothetical protein
MPLNIKELINLFNVFISKEDISINYAKKIESYILLNFPNLELFMDLTDKLAQYSPGGDDYLYNEDEIISELNYVISKLKDDNSVTTSKNI